MTEHLQTRARNFAHHLTGLVQGCIHRAPEFGVVATTKRQQLRIGPLPFNEDSGFAFIPLLRSCDRDNQYRLMLKIEFFVSLDDKSEFLAVQHSTCGLWVRPNPHKNQQRRPVFRVEYDRNARSKPSAHVHLHAESMDFGWVYGSAGLPPPRLAEIHFPVGGRRFRPTVEDFLKFLNHEQLFVDWKQGWDTVLDESLADWERTQAQATVRQHTEAAISVLQRLGYEVSTPH